jgi:hypothetical protein
MEPAMGKLVPGPAGRDGQLWTCDSVEVFLAVGGAYWHFGISAGGGLADAKGKDDTWNVDFSAAVAKEKDCWTAEFAIPLAKLTGPRRAQSSRGEVPAEWTANFNRTRLAGGATEEYAWCPTFSGDSHAVDRFGKLVLGDPPPAAGGGVPATGPGAGGPVTAAAAATVEVLPASDGVGVLRFDLSALARGAKVYRADLRLFRGAVTAKGGEDILNPLAVFALDPPAKDGARPVPAGAALAVRGPEFQTLDATAAVRAWAAARAACGEFFVKSAPPLRLEGSCLEIAMDGMSPAALPPQVAGLRAFHRAGQTFITWHDPEDAFGDKPVTWGQILDYHAQADPQRQVRCRVYRHSKPIDASNVMDAQFLGEVAPLSSFNTNGWSIERLVNQAVFSNADRGGELGKYGPFADWSRSSPEGRRLVIPRLAIEDGTALPPGAGLYVHSTPSKEAAGKAFYAVTASAGGVENLRAFGPGNSLAEPVEEVTAAWEPVLQPVEKAAAFGFDFRGQRRFYVTWSAPPLAPRDMYFNWSVLVPPNCKAPAAVELYFHAPGQSYARPPVKFLDRSIQISPHDFPFSGWYGYNDAMGTLRSPAEGTVRPHTIRRIEAFLDWAVRHLPVDDKRIVAVGGDGAGLMALYCPQRFAYVLITGFESRQLDPKAAGAFAEAWGPPGSRIKNDRGLADWAWGQGDVLVCGREMPSIVAKGEAPPPPLVGVPDAAGLELPLFICRGPSWGHDPAYCHGRGRLYYALQTTRHGLCAHWAWGGNLPVPEKFIGLWRGVDLTRDTPFPAITYSSTDKEGEGDGHCNNGYTWRDVKDEERSFHVTLAGPEGTFDLTPRRAIRFRCKPDERLAWTATSVPGGEDWTGAKQAPPPVTGQVTADKAGLVTLTGLKLERGCVLTVKIAKE